MQQQCHDCPHDCDTNEIEAYPGCAGYKNMTNTLTQLLEMDAQACMDCTARPVCDPKATSCGLVQRCPGDTYCNICGIHFRLDSKGWIEGETGDICTGCARDAEEPDVLPQNKEIQVFEDHEI